MSPVRTARERTVRRVERRVGRLGSWVSEVA